MKKITFLLTPLIMFLAYSCTTPDVTFYSGNNEYCAPALIIQSDKSIERDEIEAIFKKAYSDNNLLGELRGVVYTDSQAVLYIKANKTDKIDKEFEFTVIPFQTIKKEMDAVIKEFYAIKNKSALSTHSIYAIYFSLGTCAFTDYDPSITIISKSAKNEFYYTKVQKYNDQLMIEPIKLEHKDNTFSFTYQYQGDRSAFKRILYEVEHKNLLYKSLEYVSESDKKYMYYLFKIE